jgi:hypothetical protein
MVRVESLFLHRFDLTILCRLAEEYQTPAGCDAGDERSSAVFGVWTVDRWPKIEVGLGDSVLREVIVPAWVRSCPSSA